MKKIATWTALALATTLAGCTGAANGNRGLESVHQPVVRNTIYQFDVAAGSGDIAPSEQGRLQGWLDALVQDPHLREGLNVCEGKVTCEPVAEAHGLAYTSAESVLGL